MSKIDNIIYSYAEAESLGTGIPYSQVQFSYEEVESMMKEYAEWYAKKCLEIAAEKAKSITDIDKYIYGSIVDKDSILNIKLPEHD